MHLLFFFRRLPRAVICINKRRSINTMKWKLADGVYILENDNFPKIHGPTATEILQDVDLTGKRCLITGATSGIGLEMTRCLNARGCDISMACRNSYTANAVKSTLENNANTEIYEVNLASLKSVKKCSEEIINNNKKLDIVICNAAVFGVPWRLTEDGLETTVQVNFLSQYYLLMALERLLAPDARVVLIGSESHRNVRWDDNQQMMPTESLISIPENEYTSIKAYNTSKLCCLFVMQYLGYRWLNTDKSIFCAHPGTFVKTKLCQNWWIYEALYTIMRPFTKSVAQAAATPVYCAASPELRGRSGQYVRACGRAAAVSELAGDLRLAARVLDLSRDLLAARLDLPTGAGNLHAAGHIAPDDKVDSYLI